MSITKIVSQFVEHSPENSLKMQPDEKAFDEVLVGFSSGADPIFEAYKDLVGAFHWTPLEIFSLTVPETPVRADDLTVISWVLPHRKTTKAENRRETFYPSRRWVHARFPGEEFNCHLRRHVVDELHRKGTKAVSPVLSSQWSMEKSPKYGFASKWSERHAAYAAGLGTFGLCDGLITPKGKAHRVGSVVANLAVPSAKRPYDNHHAYCLFFYNGSCNACRKRCPVGAITDEGHNKEKCWNHAGGTCAEFVKANYVSMAMGVDFARQEYHVNRGSRKRF